VERWCADSVTIAALKSRPRTAGGRERAWLPSPERSEVDRRISRTPSLDEALDRRVQDDIVELVNSEQPVATHGGVLGVDGFQ
jgi:hypothetical protein